MTLKKSKQTKNTQNTFKAIKAFTQGMFRSTAKLPEAEQIDVEPFYSLLPYRAYDPDKQVYINTRSVMKAMELPLLSGANEELIKTLVSIVNQHIEGEIYVQFLRYTHNQLGTRLERIAQKTSKQGGVYGAIAKMRQGYCQHAARHYFPNKLDHQYGLFDSRVFLFLSLSSHKGNQVERIASLNRIARKVATGLKIAEIPVKYLDQPELLGQLRQMAYYDAASDRFDEQHEPVALLHEQVRTGAQEVRVEDDHLECENETHESHIAILTADKLPKQHALWQAADYLAHMDRYSGATSPHLVSVTFKLMPQDKAKFTASKKYFSLEKAAHSPMVKLFPKLKDQYNEWQDIRTALDKDEIRIAETMISFAVMAPKSQLEEAVESFKSNFLVNGFELRRAKRFQLPLYLSMFPGMVAEGMWSNLKAFGQVRKMTTWNLVNLLPIVGDWKGTDTGLVMPTLRNQLSAVDIFSMKTDNHNVCVAGGPGAGKSLLLQSLLFDVLADGGYVYVIDKGGSYKKICQLLGGQYLDAKHLRLNPFAYLDRIKDEIDRNIYFDVIANLLATLASPKDVLDSVSLAYLLDATIRAYQAKGTKANIDAVIQALSDIQTERCEDNIARDARLDDLSILLKKYSSEGIYGEYFNEHSDIDPDAKLIVLEMDGIEKNTGLKQAVLYSLINTISQRMYLTDRSVKKLCLIDEAWSLMKGSNQQAAIFIETGFRTSRKHGGSFCTIVQGVLNYFDKDDPCSRACWDSSDIKMIARQNEGSIPLLKSQQPDLFTDYELDTVAQFKPAYDVGFSSVMVKAGGLTAFHRLFCDPFSKVMFSTHAAEFQYVEDLQEQGMSLVDAIHQTAMKFHGDEIHSLESIARLDAHTQTKVQNEGAIAC
jgi:conjugal transfer ATP-binding protein TraC